MMNCNRIQKQIDEADAPDLLSFEVAAHLESCHGCQRFASERQSLRQMLGTMPGITVPANFQAQLKARLEERKNRSVFSWLTPANYLRFGAATAMLAVGFFVAQYAGTFDPSGPNALTAVTSRTGDLKVTPFVFAPSVGDDAFISDETVSSQSRNNVPVFFAASSSRSLKRYTPKTPEAIADDFDMPTIIVTGPAGRVSERPIRPYSVGAQDRIYLRSEAPTPVRAVSF